MVNELTPFSSVPNGFSIRTPFEPLRCLAEMDFSMVCRNVKRCCRHRLEAESNAQADSETRAGVVVGK